MNTASAVKKLFEYHAAHKTDLHALTVYCGDKKIFSGAANPYTVQQKNHVYSLSKSFCSTAVGIACDMGYLSLDDKIVDIFPEKATCGISEKTAGMTLRHVLSMNTGHSGCVMTRVLATDDPVKAFLLLEPEYVPGTHFAYNTGATYIASCCVTQKTGLTVLEFLERNLFCHMDIKDSAWFSAKGYSEGGVGFNVCCEDAAKLGLLYLNGGIWNGKRLLSQQYTEEAHSYISDNSTNGNPDWCAGYGLQFWRNYRGGYRGDGAFGQVCIVYPEKNLVIAAIAECGDMQSEMDGFFDFINDLDPDPTPVSGELDTFLEGFYPAGKFNAPAELIGKEFLIDENRSGFKYLRFDKTPDGLDIIISTAEHINTVKLCSGRWICGTMHGERVKPTLDDLTPNHSRPLEYFACATADGGKLSVSLRATNCPHNVVYTFEANGNGIEINRRAGFCNGYHEKFTGKELKI